MGLNWVGWRAGQDLSIVCAPPDLYKDDGIALMCANFSCRIPRGIDWVANIILIVHRPLILCHHAMPLPPRHHSNPHSPPARQAHTGKHGGDQELEGAASLDVDSFGRRRPPPPAAGAARMRRCLQEHVRRGGGAGRPAQPRKGGVWNHGVPAGQQDGGGGAGTIRGPCGVCVCGVSCRFGWMAGRRPLAAGVWL